MMGGAKKKDSAEACTGTARARQKRGDCTGGVPASSAETVQAVSSTVHGPSQPVQQGTSKTMAPTVGDTIGLGRVVI